MLYTWKKSSTEIGSYRECFSTSIQLGQVVILPCQTCTRCLVFDEASYLDQLPRGPRPRVSAEQDPGGPPVLHQGLHVHAGLLQRGARWWVMTRDTWHVQPHAHNGPTIKIISARNRTFLSSNKAVWLILLHAAKNENNKRCSDAESVTAFFKKCILCSFMGLKSQYLLGWRQSGVTLDQSRPRPRTPVWWHGAFSRLRASTGPAQHLARNRRTILGKLFTIIWIHKSNFDDLHLSFEVQTDRIALIHLAKLQIQF